MATTNDTLPPLTGKSARQIAYAAEQRSRWLPAIEASIETTAAYAAERESRAMAGELAVTTLARVAQTMRTLTTAGEVLDYIDACGVFAYAPAAGGFGSHFEDAQTCILRRDQQARRVAEGRTPTRPGDPLHACAFCPAEVA